MNYRHAFHAGNFGDVLKHVVLLELLDALHRKPNPVHLIDTHAGIGLYDLAADEAELKAGGSGLRRYPGSPWLLQDSVRAGDRVSLCELHPQDAETLKHTIGRDPAIAIHHRDGFEALKALTPPTPRRGLALIDPAFELKDEFDTLTKAVLLAHQRWATGQLVVWYPIKDQKSIDQWKAALARQLKVETLCIELTVRPAKDAKQMNGTGLLVVNPPWQLGETLKPMLDFLKSRMARESGAAARITNLVKPT
jgi:23S rRNA (adenine2030-N6)-methyltransferase